MLVGLNFARPGGFLRKSSNIQISREAATNARGITVFIYFREVGYFET